MKVLVIGSGGREHAITWALAKSPLVREIIVAPGNAGTWQIARYAAIPAEDVMALVKFAGEQAINLVVVGPEVPLAAGIVDAMQSVGIPVFGPTKAAAQLEASKAFSKAFMLEQGIPTADYAEFDDYDTAMQYPVERPVVVKADGLAAGKGVIMCENADDVHTALKQMMVDDVFSGAGSKVIIEEQLTGPELSVLAFCDGEHIALMPPSRDHKRAYVDNKGPNTGGMGAFTWPADVDAALMKRIKVEVLEPAIKGMAARGTPYKGVLYAGLMLTPDGPKTLEFNCRFGDPETQAILPLLESDLAEVLLACVNGTLTDVQWKSGTCATVVAASEGYPGSYPKGRPITIPDDLEDVQVFHAGTAQDDNNQLVTSGGRVLAVSAVGDDLQTALDKAYAGMENIHFEGMHYRRDIGR